MTSLAEPCADSAITKYQARRERQKGSRFFRRFYPNYVSEDDYFNRIMEECVPIQPWVLDAGCGSGEISQVNYSSPYHVIGIDRDPELADNSQVTFRVMGDLDTLPLASGTAGLIVCKYVIEHLENPAKTFSEFVRVLAPGGYVFVHTPNLQHYVQWLARLVPQRFHSRLVYALCGRPSFPKFRRANTPEQLTHLMRDAGLVCERLEFFESAPDYLQRWGPLYLLGVAYERWVNASQRRAHWRLNMIGVFHKP